MSEEFIQLQPNGPEDISTGTACCIGFLLLTLGATDLALFYVGAGFGVTLFWPALVVAALSAPTVLISRRMTDAQVAFNGFVILMLLCIGVSWSQSKTSSVALTLTFLGYGYWTLRYRNVVLPRSIAPALDWVILAYLASTVLGLFLVILGLQDSVIAFFARSWYDAKADVYRLEGLSSEPSYAAIVVTVAWLSINRLQTAATMPANRWWRAAAVLLMLLLFRSIYGLILAVLVLSTLMPIGRKPHLRLSIAAVLSFIGLVAYLLADPEGRLSRVVQAIGSLDIEDWNIVDSSSYMRFGPTYLMISDIDLLDIWTWLGRGAGASTAFFTDAFSGPVLEDGFVLQLGFFPGFVYDYGIFASMAFLIFAWLICRGPYRWQSFAIVLLMLFNANINTQLLWFVLTCLALTTVDTAPASSLEAEVPA